MWFSVIILSCEALGIYTNEAQWMVLIVQSLSWSLGFLIPQCPRSKEYFQSSSCLISPVSHPTATPSLKQSLPLTLALGFPAGSACAFSALLSHSSCSFWRPGQPQGFLLAPFPPHSLFPFLSFSPLPFILISSPLILFF